MSIPEYDDRIQELKNDLLEIQACRDKFMESEPVLALLYGILKLFLEHSVFEYNVERVGDRYTLTIVYWSRFTLEGTYTDNKLFTNIVESKSSTTRSNGNDYRDVPVSNQMTLLGFVDYALSKRD